MIIKLSQFKNSYREIYWGIILFFQYEYIINFFSIIIFTIICDIISIYLYLFNKKYKFIDNFMSVRDI